MVGDHAILRVDVRSLQSAKVRLPDNASLPAVYNFKRHYLLNYPGRIELYDAYQDRVLGSRLLKRKIDEDELVYAVNEKVVPIEGGSIAAAAVSINSDGAEEITVIDVADGRVLQAGPSEGEIVPVEDAGRRGVDGPPPDGAFLLERRKGRLEPLAARALRHAYCQRLHDNRDSLLTWPIPDDASEEPKNTAESRRRTRLRCCWRRHRQRPCV
jgi:hypothetical protein